MRRITGNTRGVGYWPLSRLTKTANAPGHFPALSLLCILTVTHGSRHRAITVTHGVVTVTRSP